MLPQELDGLRRRGRPSRSGQTATDSQTTALPGSRYVIDPREAALPTAPERRRTASSGPAAVVPTLFGASLSQHCPGRRRDPTLGLWPSSARSTGPETPSTPCSTRSSRSTWKPSLGRRWRWPATARVCRSSSGAPAGADHPPDGVDVGYPQKDAYDLSRRLAFARRHGRRVNPRHLDLDVGRRLFAGLLVDPRRHDGFGHRNPEPDERRKRDDSCIHTTQDTRHYNEADCRCDATCSCPPGRVRVLQRADSPR